MIRGFHDLRPLLFLPDTQLNADQKTQILTTLKGKMGSYFEFGLNVHLLLNSQLNKQYLRLILADAHYSQEEYFIEILKITPDVADILRIAKEMGVTKEGVVEYIGRMPYNAKVPLIQKIFDRENGGGLHAFFATQRGFSRTAENHGSFKKLAEMIVPSLKELGFFSRTAYCYRETVVYFRPGKKFF